ncbi:MAG: hypothetical protein ACLFPJ_00785 [Candidatus Woesearchaeota archaeon]
MKNSLFAKIYFILMIFYGVLNILANVIKYLVGVKSPLFIIVGSFLTIYSLAVIILSIVALVNFIKNNFSKSILIVPCIILGMFVVGLFMGIIGLVMNINFVGFLGLFDLISAFFIIGFSIYQLIK